MLTLHARVGARKVAARFDVGEARHEHPFFLVLAHGAGEALGRRRRRLRKAQVHEFGHLSKLGEKKKGISRKEKWIISSIKSKVTRQRPSYSVLTGPLAVLSESSTLTMPVSTSPELSVTVMAAAEA